MSPSPIASVKPEPGTVSRVIWLTTSLFLSYLCVAMSLPVTSVFVTDRLGFGNALAGLAVGMPFASTIFTRGIAGRLSDRHGGKPCVVWGLLVYAVASLICAGANWPHISPTTGYALLVAGRLLLGWGESLSAVGLIAWALAVMGPQHAGRVFALVGMGFYGSFAVGSPIGVAVFDRFGLTGTMLACAGAPIVGIFMVLPVVSVRPQAGERAPLRHVLGRIWQPGVVVALQGVGFAAIGAFLSLMFLRNAWPHAGLGLTCFGAAFVLVRAFFGHLPDRVGSFPVALVSLAVEASGQCLLWSASGPSAALAGAFLTGVGCSLVFPAMGIQVIRRVPPHLRGTAAGGFAAFQDLAYALTGPVTGLLADRFGYAIVFLVGGVAASFGFMLAAALARQGRRGGPHLNAVEAALR